MELFKYVAVAVGLRTLALCLLPLPPGMFAAEVPEHQKACTERVTLSNVSHCLSADRTFVQALDQGKGWTCLLVRGGISLISVPLMEVEALIWIPGVPQTSSD